MSRKREATARDAVRKRHQRVAGELAYIVGGIGGLAEESESCMAEVRDRPPIAGASSSCKSPARSCSGVSFMAIGHQGSGRDLYRRIPGAVSPGVPDA